MSSATSGFFFCGMMLLPVHRASGRERKRNSEDDQYTISSASRDRRVIVTAQGERGPGQRPRPERRDVHAPARLHEPVGGPGEHLPVRQEVMGEEDRLGPLQMGVAGKDDPEKLFGPGGDGLP